MQQASEQVQLINLSEMPPSWNWLHQEIQAPHLSWKHCSSLSHNVPTFLPKHKSFGRLLSAHRSINLAQKSSSVLISHAPRSTYYGAQLAALKQKDLPHLAVSFTFTVLPTGLQHKLMSKFYQQVDRFVLYSNMEKKLYADYFDLDESKFDMIHWPVHPPTIEDAGEPLESGPYICAIGSQGRDYRVLFHAMERLKHIKCVVVATPENLIGLKVPENVKIYTNIPLSDCNNIVQHSQFMVLPLISDKTPCGHSSIVSAMFHKKAILVTNALTIKDYIHQDETGRLFTHQDDLALANEIERLWESPKDIRRLAANALTFANAHCTERTAVNYFRSYLEQIGKKPSAQDEQPNYSLSASQS